MAKKKKSGREKNPMQMVLYIAVVAVLLGCIVYFWYCRQQQKSAYQDTMQQLKNQESDETFRQGWETELKTLEGVLQESEEETQAETEPQTEPKGEGREKTAAPAASGGGKAGKETQPPQGTSSESEAAEAESESETGAVPSGSDQIDRDIHIVVLNGTGKEGIAGYWEKELEALGYQNVVPASYGTRSEERTVLMVEEIDYAKPLLELFPNATVTIQSNITPEGVEVSEGKALPEQVDVWIIVGKEDAEDGMVG